MSNIASVHRFMGDVALSIGGGETVYLSVHQASVLSDALARCAVDIPKTAFTASKFGTINIGKETGQRRQG
tara:strand:+ start:1867 stop:2079 length:213 start_codon:yes stop_codon:yes gene_type:complete